MIIWNQLGMTCCSSYTANSGRRVCYGVHRETYQAPPLSVHSRFVRQSFNQNRFMGP